VKSQEHKIAGSYPTKIDAMVLCDVGTVDDIVEIIVGLADSTPFFTESYFKLLFKSIVCIVKY
jgi:hypothetical protein